MCLFSGDSIFCESVQSVYLEKRKPREKCLRLLTDYFCHLLGRWWRKQLSSIFWGKTYIDTEGWRHERCWVFVFWSILVQRPPVSRPERGVRAVLTSERPPASPCSHRGCEVTSHAEPPRPYRPPSRPGTALRPGAACGPSPGLAVTIIRTSLASLARTSHLSPGFESDI